MKTHLAASLLMALAAGNVSAQWITREYSLVTGWNGVWLAGDASHASVDELFAAYPAVTEVWRWNPNPDQIQFTTNPSTPTTNSDEWTAWKRNDPDERLLSKMIGNSAYLLRCSGATSLRIKQKALPPQATWLISGANFLGFPAAGTGVSGSPTMSAYFASYPSAASTVLAPGAQIYKYIGGELSSANPMLVNPPGERMDPNKAYWFQIPTVSDFTAALEYEVAGDDGLAFGRTLNTMTVGVMNRSTAGMTLNVSLESSEVAPAGQPGVVGGVPLTRRVFNSSTGGYDETPVQSGFAVTVDASGRLNLDFGLDRSQVTSPTGIYASLLRIKDAAGLTDVRIPVTAEAATPAGLWGARVQVTHVVSQVPGGSGSTTSQPFPLAFLVHVDSAGTPRLLSQAFTGRLTSEGNPPGIAVKENLVLASGQSDIEPRRYVSCQLPLDQAIGGSGAVATGSTVSWNISIPHNDPTNPFVHAYHPDHDNLNAAFKTPVAEGEESYSIQRTCSFEFTATPPSGVSVSGWGTTVLGGSYAETITGLNSRPLEVRGTFIMGRISETAEIQGISQP